MVKPQQVQDWEGTMTVTRTEAVLVILFFLRSFHVHAGILTLVGGGLGRCRGQGEHGGGCGEAHAVSLPV